MLRETSDKMNQNSTTKFVNSIADLNSTDLNITDLMDFMNTLMHMKKYPELPPLKPIHTYEECMDYCHGTIRDLLLEYRNLHGYITLVICLFGTIANIFNIIVLTRKDMCKAPINIILKWLAVADMFVMLEYIPFSVYMYLIFPDKQDFQYSWAVYLLFHMHFTQILHTISILLTVTLAVWRYIAIQHSHGTFAVSALTHVGEAIFCSFILSPILCFPTYFVFGIKQTTVWENNTVIMLYHLDAKEETALYRFNFWIHSIIIKLVPCIILTMISLVLIRVLCQATKRKNKLKSYSQPKSAGDPTQNGLVHQRSLKQDRRADRTTTLLVAVLLLFLVTEIPQGILGLLSGILDKCFFSKCYSMFGEIMDLLALINAAIGFVLYGLMSKQFRTSFKSIFIKRNVSHIEMTRVTAINTTCV